jgi:Flp pilus assembly CpaE family ATPase
MKAQGQYTLADAADCLHRLDADLWKGLISTTEDGIDVIPPPGAAAFTGVLEPDRARHVLRFACGLYRHVVVDLGVLSPMSLALLEDTANLYIVAAEELPALWEAGRLLGRLTKLGFQPESLHFLVNFKKRRGGLSASELEKVFGHAVYGTVLAARDEMEDYLSGGRFVDVKSQVHKDVAKVVARMLGKDEPETSSGGFRFSRLVSK